MKKHLVPVSLASAQYVKIQDGFFYLPLCEQIRIIVKKLPADSGGWD